MSSPSTATWDARHILDALLAGRDLSFEEATELASHVAENTCCPHQLSAVLGIIASRGETSEVVAAFASVMRQACIAVTLIPASSEGSGVPQQPLLDIVGTGGDGFNTVNISTASAVVAASCGARVAKHGSISVSSRSGAADVLRELGVAMLGPEGVAQSLDKAGMAFMFAPLFHPALKHVVPVRKALKIRTVFNILGPLLNPAGATRLLLGVYKPSLLHVYADAVRKLGAERALIVHCCGLDELAPIGLTKAVEVFADGSTKDVTIDPTEWGVPRCTVEDLKGGEPSDNAAIILDTLAGEGAAQGGGADSHVGRTIALNAGAALYVYGIADSVKHGYELAAEAIRSGTAGQKLSAWAAITREIAEAESST